MLTNLQKYFFQNDEFLGETFMPQIYPHKMLFKLLILTSKIGPSLYNAQNQLKVN